MFLGDKNTDGKLNGLDVNQLLGDIDFGDFNVSSMGSFTQGSNPADVITETTSPTSFNFSGDSGRDLHDYTDVTITNGTTSSVTEDVTVELYDGSDTTGTLVTSEARSITVGASSTVTEGFIYSPDQPLDNGTYHIEITTSGSTLSIDQTDEGTKGATYTFGQTNTGDFYLRNQDGTDLLHVNSLGPIEVNKSFDMGGSNIQFDGLKIWDNAVFDIETSGGKFEFRDAGNTSLLNIYDGSDEVSSPSIDINGRTSLNYEYLGEAVIAPWGLTGSHSGTQDDFLNYAHKHSTVSQTSGSSPTTRSLSKPFENNHTDVRWDDTSTYPIEIEIDFGSKVHYWDGGGLHFNYGRMAQNITMEMYDKRNGTWKEVGSTTSNSSSTVHFNFGGSHYSKMRVRFSGTVHSSGEIAIERIFGFNGHQNGNAWFDKGGDTVYGDINFEKGSYFHEDGNGEIDAYDSAGNGTQLT